MIQLTDMSVISIQHEGINTITVIRISDSENIEGAVVRLYPHTEEYITDINGTVNIPLIEDYQYILVQKVSD